MLANNKSGLPPVLDKNWVEMGSGPWLRSGSDRLRSARPALARLGSARGSSAWLGSSRLLGLGRLGLARLGLAWLGSARLGPFRLGLARFGLAEFLPTPRSSAPLAKLKQFYTLDDSPPGPGKNLVESALAPRLRSRSI